VDLAVEAGVGVETEVAVEGGGSTDWRGGNRRQCSVVQVAKNDLFEFHLIP